MTGPGPSDPSGQAPPPPGPEPAPAAPDAAAAAGAAGAAGGDASQAGGQWAQQGQTPDWAKQAAGWRPAEAAAGPAAGVAFADLTTRIIAIIIDFVILGIVGFVVNLILLTAFIATLVSTGSVIFLLLSVVVLVFNVLLAGIYFVYTWTNMKASPGQRILGLMTVAEADGSALGINAATRPVRRSCSPRGTSARWHRRSCRESSGCSCRSPVWPGRST